MAVQAAKMVLRTELLEQFRAVLSTVLKYLQRGRVIIGILKQGRVRKGLTSAQIQNSHQHCELRCKRLELKRKQFWQERLGL
jgi:hypothetical protein